MIRACIGLLAILLGIGSPMASAETDVEQRIGDEIDATLLRLIESGLLADRGGRPLTIEREPRVRFELGAVVEIDEATGTAPVVAITPGGSAARMGLQVGDRITAINGVDLTRSADPRGDFARSTSRANGWVTLTLRRGERELQIQGEAERVLVPGFRLRIEQPDLGPLVPSNPP